MATSFAARPGTLVPPWVVALLAPGDAPVAAETRVRGLNAGAGVDDWGVGGERPSRHWGNEPSHDRMASGSTQFLSRDPATARTGQPYGYALDNPLNVVDPTGLDSWGNDTGMCANPADRTSNISCSDARAFYYWCSGGTQHDQLNCEAENYYDEYFRAYTMLQNIYQQGTASEMDPKCLDDLVAHELHGIIGDIYVDNTKSKVLPGVHESAADEDQVHLFGPFYYPWNAPGVHANGTVDFYTQAGPHPLKLSDFKDVNG